MRPGSGFSPRKRSPEGQPGPAGPAGPSAITAEGEAYAAIARKRLTPEPAFMSPKEILSASRHAMLAAVGQDIAESALAELEQKLLQSDNPIFDLGEEGLALFLPLENGFKIQQIFKKALEARTEHMGTECILGVMYLTGEPLTFAVQWPDVLVNQYDFPDHYIPFFVMAMDTVQRQSRMDVRFASAHRPEVFYPALLRNQGALVLRHEAYFPYENVDRVVFVGRGEPSAATLQDGWYWDQGGDELGRKRWVRKEGVWVKA